MKNFLFVFLLNIFAFLFLRTDLEASSLSQKTHLTQTDIEYIFDTFVKVYDTQEYINRYVPLPLDKNNLSWRWEDKDFARIIPLLEFERFITENKISAEKALAFNGMIDPEWNYISCQSIVEVNYEDDTEKYDLHNLQLQDSDFDFVMMNNTLEHVYDPIRCLKNIYKYMRPKGILYLEVPVNSIPHSTPYHYYTGITPTGLGAMVVSAGFRILHIGQWGNHDYLKKMYKKKFWPDYRELKNPGFNDLSHPVSAWIFAVKD